MSFDPNNDADWDTLALNESAANAANGVCGICDEALNPLLAKWAKSYTSPRYTAEVAAECVGPVHPTEPYHQRCVDDVEKERAEIAADRKARSRR